MPYTTREEILELGKIDPELAEHLRTTVYPPVDYTDLQSFKDFAERRNVQLRELLGEPPEDIKQSETHYTTQDGTKMRVKVYQPSKAPSDGSPLIVMYHGGGFCIGTPEGEEQTCRNLVHGFGAVCFSASYRLAPEFKFPYAVTDSWDALRWAAENGPSFGADLSKGFVVGGTSAGGNISAVLAHLARDEGLSPKLTGQYLAIPAVGSGDVIPEKYRSRWLSYEQNKNAPVLPMDAINMFMEGYQPDPKDYVRYKVMAHPKGHHGLPPAYLQIDGLDPLRDEALIYADILAESGVKIKADVYPGLPHGHWGFFPFLESSKKFRKEQVKGFGWLLGREPSVQKVTTQANATTV